MVMSNRVLLEVSKCEKRPTDVLSTATSGSTLHMENMLPP